MKTNLLKAIALAIVMTPLYNCSVEPTDQLTEELITVQSETVQITEIDDDPVSCNGEIPKSRVTNNSNNVVNFEIHDANNVLVSYVYGLNPGETSDWKTFPVGMTTFTVSTADSLKPVKIDMGLCMAYEVSINENNQLDTDIPTQL